MQQEQREAGLRRHAGDPADRHVGAPGAVEELHVDVDRRAVPAAAHRDPVGHLVEVQRLGPLAARGAAHHLARARRHVDLRLHPGGGDLGDLLRPGGQHALGDEEDVRAEARALLPGPHLGDDAAGQHRPDPRHVPQRHHHVVELQVRGLVEGDGELQRRRVLGPRHQADLTRRIPLEGQGRQHRAPQLPGNRHPASLLHSKRRDRPQRLLQMKRIDIPDTGVSTVDGPADNAAVITCPSRSSVDSRELSHPSGTRTGVDHDATRATRCVPDEQALQPH